MTAILSPGKTDAAVPDASDVAYHEVAKWVAIAGHRDKARAFLAEKQFASAVGECDAALSLCATCGEIWQLRGLALEQWKHHERAYKSFAQAAILTPIFPEARRSVARLGELLGHPRDLLTPWHDNPRPTRLGRLSYWVRKRTTPEADQALPEEDELRELAVRNPSSAYYAAKLGRRLYLSGRYVEAECFLRYALALGPWQGMAAFYLYRIVMHLGYHEEAKAIVTKAVVAGATERYLPALAFWASRVICDWSDVDDWAALTLKQIKARPLAAEALTTLYLSDDPAVQYRVAVAGAKGYALNSKRINGDFRRTADRPLTIGYISADFRGHAVAYLIAELFELHDRKRFRIFGYSVFKDAASQIGDRIRGSFDKFGELFGLPAQVAAQRIKDDGVDILVDLTGHTLYSPLPILACRPAPVQVTYLGYPGTTGSPDVDYIVADKTIIPREQEKWFSEKIVYMPDCYQVNDRQRYVDERMNSRVTFGLPANAFVYCCFNESRKVDRALFQVWMRILSRVPNSVLWFLKANAVVTKNLREEALAAGIDPARLIFAPRLPAEQHLARYVQADLFLDTLFYNAHTTASDAIWGGCPLVTVLGKTFPARVAASILRAAGLPELVTSTLQEYEDLAIRIGLDQDFARSLRKKAEAARAAPIFDSPRFTRHLEWAFDRMWDTYVQGQAPASFDVPALDE